MRLRLGLTQEQLAARKQGIGGSDAPRIMRGEWYGLWCEKTGRAEAEDLSGNLAVCMGSFTEPLNLYWLEMTTGRRCTNEGEVRVHPQYPWMRCTLDALTDDGRTVVQCKHIGGFQPLEEVVAKYVPQVTHEMLVCGVSRALLCFLIGNAKHEVVPIELDEFYGCDLIDREKSFWMHVLTDTAPEGAPKEIAPPKIETFREVDMSQSNAWPIHAATWLETKPHADRFKAAEKEIKALVDADVGLAFGAGIKVSRSKAGALTIREAK